MMPKFDPMMMVLSRLSKALTTVNNRYNDFIFFILSLADDGNNEKVITNTLCTGIRLKIGPWI